MWIMFLALLLFGVILGFILHNRQQGLRVLMYHKVDPTHTDMLTVTTEQLLEQLTFLQTAGYSIITMPQLLAFTQGKTNSLPKRPVLITFDDAYENNLTYALPILKERQIPATIFVPTAFVGGVNEWDSNGGLSTADILLTADQLKGLTLENISLAYHSHRHINYKHTAIADIKSDLQANSQTAKSLALPMQAAFAYPYGGRPKKDVIRLDMQHEMERLGIQLAFRIGNRINPLPIRHRYDINRIDVRGTDSMADFKRKVTWGKLI